jgi:predicted tellurium resistance membrane protein TerC
MNYEIIVSLFSLIALEVVLGIDNVIFISILANKLPLVQQKRARQLGLILAALARLGLLLLVTWIMRLDKPLFEILNHSFSGKDIILILGGLFLLYKSTKEIYHKMEGESGDTSKKMNAGGFTQVLIQILIMDLVFSIDSIITAVGMVKEIWVMYVAVIVTVLIMMFAAEPISNFVNKHPAFKVLALSFLMLIGFSLIAEGMKYEIPKGYIYFSMLFALVVDVVQMIISKGKQTPVDIHEHYQKGEDKYPKDIV